MSPGNPAVAALAVFVAYTVLVGVLWRLTGTRYDHLVDSRSTILRGIVLPIGLGGLLLAVMTTWFGWWESALLPGASGPSWALIVPLLFAVVAVLNIASIDWRSAKARLLPLLLLGTALVGFAEELASRGQLAVGLRESGASEVTVWLVTSILFALLHGMNVLFGQSGRTTLLQVVAAFFAGTVRDITNDDDGLADRRHGAACAVGLRDAGDPGHRPAAEAGRRNPGPGHLPDCGRHCGLRPRRRLGTLQQCDVDHYESTRLRECPRPFRRCDL